MDTETMLRNRKLLPVYCLCGQKLETIKDEKGKYRYHCSKCNEWKED